jgi:signal transduction histidine kinase/ligand-binding sensor protein
MNVQEKHLQWPHPATTILSFEKEWAVLCLSGLRDRFEMPMVLCIDVNEKNTIIRPEDPYRFYPGFCSNFRLCSSSNSLSCDESTVSNAKRFFKSTFNNLNNPKKLFVYSEKCHLGLTNLYCPLFIEDYLVGVVVAGKFCKSKEDLHDIKNNINNLCFKKRSFSVEQLQSLISEINSILIIEKNSDIKKLNNSFLEAAKILSGLLSGLYSKNKILAQRRNRNNIEEQFSLVDFEVDSDKTRSGIVNVFKIALEYIGCKYIALFLSDKPYNNILDIEISCNLYNVQKGDIHFNWKKANIPIKRFSIKAWNFMNYKESIIKGIKGIQKSLILDLSYFFPLFIEGYLGAIILGPIDRNYNELKEIHFLNSYCFTLGHNSAGNILFQIIKLGEADKVKAIQLAAHMTRQGLQDILNSFDLIDYDLNSAIINIGEIRSSVKIGKQHIEMMRNRLIAALDAPEAIRAIIPTLKPSHLEFKATTPAAFLDYIYHKHKANAERNGLILVLDTDSVDDLPAIKTDPDLLTLVFDNLIENAIKYSKKNSEIRIWGKLLSDNNFIEITIKNIGLGIKDDEMNKIFEPGYRSDLAKKYFPNTGHGLGLDHVKQIIDIHQKARISVDCAKVGNSDWDHLIKFRVEIATYLALELGRLK